MNKHFPPLAFLAYRHHTKGLLLGKRRRHFWVLALMALPQLLPGQALAAAPIANNTPFPDASGSVATFSTQGGIDLGNTFFQPLSGSNGRACSTCHLPGQGWSITPQGVQQRFNSTAGTDPIFRTNDGANAPQADVSTLAARRTAYSMLLNKAAIRIGLPVPTGAEFELVDISDPYHFVTQKDITPGFQLSLFRRPLPASNLKFVSSVLWDGRETFAGQSIHYDLAHQANDANTGHAQAKPLTAMEKQAIVGFETSLFTAQIYDNTAKDLTVAGVKGGPAQLSKQGFYSGINAFLGDSKTGHPFNPQIFKLYDAWDYLTITAPTDIRAAIARGQHLFNTKPLTITGVAGLNGTPEFGNASVVIGTCGTCHNAPEVGSHSANTFFNTGTADEVQRTGDLPLYTLQNLNTGEQVKTSDPGRALVTGKWDDIGRFKVPSLRGLAARAPYFHNGMAGQLGNVLDFYDQRFQIGLNNRERLDLILFLSTL